MFMDNLNNELNNTFNTAYTENGAVAFKTSGSALVDLNFSVTSLRSASTSEIISKFINAFMENKNLAMRWLFFARDIREGLGERRLFRTVLPVLTNYGVDLTKIISLIPEYGRWDDLWCIVEAFNDDSNEAQAVYHLVEKQLEEDLRAYTKNKSISLLAKWLPSINASSYNTKALAKRFIKALGYTDSTYRKMLSKLRKHLNVVEVKMCDNDWSSIEYSSVPSKANIIYSNAFMRHDPDRRSKYLENLSNGNEKINASTLCPHDIVHKYCSQQYFVTKKDPTLEALWEALPAIDNLDSTLVVADGSGSMNYRIGESRVSALDVANALAIYFAQYCSGEFYNKYITFSERPQLVDINKSSLIDKLNEALRHNECANTNIEKVFDLVLSTAINNKMPQNELPKNILIISDMEFDDCATCCSDHENMWFNNFKRPNMKLFEVIKNKFTLAGYKMPRLIFWNVCGRTNSIPVKENDLGVTLVSGFSTNIAKMIMSNKLDPYESLVEVLMNHRYDPIIDALN